VALTRRLFVSSGAATAVSYLVGLDRVAAKRKRRTFARAGVAQGVGTVGITVARTRVLLPSEWPDATNTGVPAGTSLTPVTGNFNTSSDGQTVDALDVTDGAIVIDHDNCIVKRCRVSSNSFPAIFISTGGAGTLTIEDCELGCQNNSGSTSVHYDSAVTTAVTMRRCNIHSIENGVGIGASNFDMRDCWIHDLDPAGADPHIDGIQCSPNVDNVNIIHNNFEMHEGGGASSVIQLNTTDLSNQNWVIENNRLILTDTEPGQGALCVRLAITADTGQNIFVRDNRMMPGLFGYVTPTPASMSSPG
jgi:hypothetical protein